MKTYNLKIDGSNVTVTQWGENDWDVYFEKYDCSVRGTFADIIREIIEQAECTVAANVILFAKQHRLRVEEA